MAITLNGIEIKLLNGVLTHNQNGVETVLHSDVVDAFAVESSGSVALYWRTKYASTYFASQSENFQRWPAATSDYRDVKDTGTAIPIEGNPVILPIVTSDTIDMLGNRIVGGKEAANDDGFVILIQLRQAIANLTADVINPGDQANADAIAALTNIVNNLDLDSGLSEAQVTAIADARVAAGLLSQFDNATMQSLLDQLQSQLSAVDTIVINDVATLTTQMADLEPRVAATEAQNTQQDTRLAAIEAVDVAQAERMTTIEGVNSAQDSAIASLQAGLATEAQTNSTQGIQLQGHQTAITNLNAVTTPIVVELRNGIVSSASGVPMNAVSIDSSNDTHMLVTIDANGRKNCEATFLRVLNGVGKEALCDKYRAGVNQDKYVFGIKKVVGGASDATFQLSGGYFF